MICFLPRGPFIWPIIGTVDLIFTVILSKKTLLIPTKSVIFHGVSVEYVEKSLFRSIPVKSITKLKTMTCNTQQPGLSLARAPSNKGSSGEFHFCLAAEYFFQLKSFYKFSKILDLQQYE